MSEKAQSGIGPKWSPLGIPYCDSCSCPSSCCRLCGETRRALVQKDRPFCEGCAHLDDDEGRCRLLGRILDARWARSEGCPGICEGPLREDPT